MVFEHQFYAASVLIIITLVMHSAGTTGLIYWQRDHFARGVHPIGSFSGCVLMVRFVSLILCLHLLEILLWAAFYHWKCFPDWESAFYFSATSYSTVGYGDVVLQRAWRSLGPIESLTGVLMCGFSASFLFAIVLKLVASDTRLHER